MEALTFRPPGPEEVALLAAVEAEDPARLAALGIPPGAPERIVEERASLLRAVWPGLVPLVGEDRAPFLLDVAWTLWLPLAELLLRRAAKTPRVQGIKGPVGSGKSTLVRALAHILESRGIRVAILSLDDLYPPAGEGGIRRGPPGSHDVARGVLLLESFRRGTRPLVLPRFDKGARKGRGDRIADEVLPGADLLLFEGWFVGDASTDEYLPLWERLDDLWVLRAPSEAQIRLWRHDAEVPRRKEGTGLTVEEVDALLDRMLGALPPSQRGAVTPGPGLHLPDTRPPASLVVDLDAFRRQRSVWVPDRGGTGPLSTASP